MWQQLQCDYYVELILKLISETYSLLCAEACKLEECLARKSNLENSISILQELLLNYKIDKLLPVSYLKLYGPLIDLKTYVKKIDQGGFLNNREALCNDLKLYREKIETIYYQLSVNQ
jgi:hypothetical protein